MQVQTRLASAAVKINKKEKDQKQVHFLAFQPNTQKTCFGYKNSSSTRTEIKRYIFTHTFLRR